MKLIDIGQFTHPTGAYVVDLGVQLVGRGVTVPANGTKGFKTGSVFQKTDGGPGSCLYINEGTENSCQFRPIFSLEPQSTTGTVDGFTAGSGDSANDDSTYTGDIGTTAYTVGDIVRALKNVGILEM